VTASQNAAPEYVALLSKYWNKAQDAPPGARPMQLRMFYIPDEPDGEL
jgi:hypothetical protein